MKVGVMQPYFLPYIGYWQLINTVDKYVIYDDVNFIKGGWVNRNRILIDNKPKLFNLPMLGASSNKLINEISVNTDKNIIRKNLRIIDSNYKKAPYYHEIYPIVENVLNCEKNKISEFIKNSFVLICEYLDIKTEFILSSTLKKDCLLKGQEKVLQICEILKATEYYNAINGQKLYSFSDFNKKGIKLIFLQTKDIKYQQFNNAFIPNLSIIDVLMFNDKEAIKKMLGECQLI